MLLRKRHILGMNDLSRQDISKILSLASQFKRSNKTPQSLKGKTVINLFFEPSTRTRTSFEMAAKRLGAQCININVAQSSTVKGETLIDTARNIQAMDSDLLVIRHHSSGAPYILSKVLKMPMINAGDGFHSHPTQALLDLMTIQEQKKKIKGLHVLIVGDIAHSRVARSNIIALNKMGAHPMVCAPPTLLPPLISHLGVKVSSNLKKAVGQADVIMMLRIQKERQHQHQFPSQEEYVRHFGLNQETLKNAKPGVIIMHPGPLNRGIEISPEIADGPYSVILSQVTNGVVIRMALLHLLASGRKK